MNTTQLVLVGVFAALAGACVGSFVGVIVDRMPYPLDEPDEFGDLWGTRTWREVVGGESRCSDCGADLRRSDNIPVFGWIRLRGRCRACSAPIPRYLLLLEVLVPALGAFVVWRLGGLHWVLLPALWLIPAGVAVAAIDIRSFIVPTKIIWPAFAVSVVLTISAALLDSHPRYLLGALVGVACLSGPLFIVWFVLPSGMGFGDVRLTVLLGWTVGYVAMTIGASDRVIQSVFMAVMCLGIAAVVGIVFSVVGLGARGRKAKVPFGPPLVFAALVCIGYAGNILRFFQITG